MNLRSTRTIDREEVIATNGVVATKHPVESSTGIDIMRAGGNAIDAAVAIGFAATVLEPGMVTLGGVGMLHYHDGPSGETYTVDFLGRAPLAATPDMYPWTEERGNHLSTYAVPDGSNILGHRSVCVPSLVAGLLEAHSRWGRLPREAVLEPAIALAEGGIPADQYLNWHLMFAQHEAMQFAETARVYYPGGAPPSLEPRGLLRQADLGATLRRIARDGRDAFYTGEIAAAIDDDMRANGGIITRKDLDACRPAVVPSLAATYRDCEIRFSDLPTGLQTGVQALNILGQFELRDAGHNSAEALHLYIEAARHAFADRFYYMTDPDFEPVPLDGLLSTDYARTLAALIDRGRASHGEGGELPAVRFGLEPLHDPWPFDRSGKAPKAFASANAAPATTHTTSFAVAAKDGSMVVCTETTGECLGSKVTVPGTGIVLNDMMALFGPRPGTANSIAPWKRTLGSTTAPIVLRNGRPYFAMGSPGGRHIMACGQQVMMNVIDQGMSIQPAISAPRVDPVTEVTTYDDRIAPEVIDRLEALGHRMVPVAMEQDPYSWSFAQPTGVMFAEDGTLRAGADPFVRAEARGW